MNQAYFGFRAEMLPAPVFLLKTVELRDLEGRYLFQGTPEECADFLRLYFLGKLRSMA